ncbi:MAG TPA: hypothetical protein VN625_05550, partial [Desulfuromonadaceae bacterium]|nr:hypothetical protein [Desulfuromonadaceae bacterium]
LYLHVFTGSWPADGKLVLPGLKNKIKSAEFLKSNWIGWHKGLKVRPEGNNLVISVPKTAPEKISTTIVLKIKGQPEVQ